MNIGGKMQTRAKIPKRIARYHDGLACRDVENVMGDDTNVIDYDSQDKEEARWASVSSVTVYIVGQVLGIWVIITRTNELTLSFSEGHYSYVLTFSAVVIATNILYCIVMYSDPGWLRSDRDDDTCSFEESAISDYSPTLKDAQWCKYCKRTKLLRAKHCHQCGVCVAKFDHHCYWIYNCVGGLNHCRFWWLLLLILMSLSWGNSLVWTSYVPTNRRHTNDIKNLLPLIMTAVGFMSWLFVFVVFVCHTVLALCNCTTWEFAKRSKIPYLNTLPFEKNPFDRGYWGNIRSFCCTRQTVWKLPPNCEPEWV